MSETITLEQTPTVQLEAENPSPLIINVTTYNGTVEVDVNSLPGSTISQSIPGPVEVVAAGVPEPISIELVNLGSLPGGPAGGSLTGTFPNPDLAPTGVQAGKYQDIKSVTVRSDGRLSAIETGPAPVYDKFYSFEQLNPAKIWLVTHNLGKYPAIRVYDSAGSEIEGDTIFVDLNRVELHFSAAFSGKAYFN